MSRSLIPNSTQIPDVILDDWMPLLSGAEIAIVMLVARKTFGWGKDRDMIGAAQMEAGTGLDRATIFRVCQDLKSLSVLSVESKNDGKTPNSYALGVEHSDLAYANLVARSELARQEKAEKKRTGSHFATSDKKRLVVNYGGVLVAKCDPQETLLETIPSSPQSRDAETPEPSAPPTETAIENQAEDKTAIEDKTEAPKANTKIKPAKPQKHDSEGFLQFYQRYPRHVARTDAEAAWNRLKPDIALQAEIVAGVARMQAVPDWDRENKRFVPLPATFLNKRRWEDELAPVPADPAVASSAPRRLFDPAAEFARTHPSRAICNAAESEDVMRESIL